MKRAFVWKRAKEKVGRVMDRIDQRGLSDRSRKQENLMKIVADTSNNREILIAKSEYSIFPYNNKNETLIAGG